MPTATPQTCGFLQSINKLQTRSTSREKRRQSHFQTSLGPRRTFTESCWLVQFIQAATQMIGVSAIQYYSVTVFVSSSQSSDCFLIHLRHLLIYLKKQIGIIGTQTLKHQAINSVIGLIAEALIMLFVDKLGRRTLIIWGNLAMCCTFIVSRKPYPP